MYISSKLLVDSTMFNFVVWRFQITLSQENSASHDLVFGKQIIDYWRRIISEQTECYACSNSVAEEGSIVTLLCLEFHLR